MVHASDRDSGLGRRGARIVALLVGAALGLSGCSKAHVVVVVGDDRGRMRAEGCACGDAASRTDDVHLLDAADAGAVDAVDLTLVEVSVADAMAKDADGAMAIGSGVDVGGATAADAAFAEATPTTVASSSCAGGLMCGALSCCDAKTLPSTTFMQGRATAGPEGDACWKWTKWPAYCDATFEQPEFHSTVSSFVLDTFEVTVGRFRKFLEAYPASQPADGAGAHPKIAGSGWDPAWNASLPTNRAALIASVACEPFYATWTDLPAANENKPINCLDWYVAFAFCAWDGGRLPTEAEWELAASGGEDRVLPWEVPPAEAEPDITHAIFGCQHNAAGLLCTGVTNIADVGSVPLGAARWGHLDMAGNVWEWNLDVLAAYDTSARTDYANLASGAYRVQRGGSFSYRSGGLRAAQRGYQVPWARSHVVGVRCARSSTRRSA
jgi:formylglycine-generating enzyme required for sulfatase activity